MANLEERVTALEAFRQAVEAVRDEPEPMKYLNTYRWSRLEVKLDNLEQRPPTSIDLREDLSQFKLDMRQSFEANTAYQLEQEAWHREAYERINANFQIIAGQFADVHAQLQTIEERPAAMEARINTKLEAMEARLNARQEEAEQRVQGALQQLLVMVESRLPRQDG